MEHFIGNLEHFIGYLVPQSLKYLLWRSGYDSMIGVKQISGERIKELEEFIQKNRSELLHNSTFNENFNMLDDMCVYQKQTTFQFLPGHKNILLDLPESIQKMQSQNALQNTLHCDNSSDNFNEYSVILCELIKTAEKNRNKSKNAYHYENTIKYFSTYIFLLCGRTCYETLTKNLPIPSTKTVCEYLFC